MSYLTCFLVTCIVLANLARKDTLMKFSTAVAEFGELEGNSTMALIILATKNDIEYSTKQAIVEGAARVDIHRSMYVGS